MPYIQPNSILLTLVLVFMVEELSAIFIYTNIFNDVTIGHILCCTYEF